METTMIKLPFFLSYVLGLLFLYYVLVMIGTTAVVNCEKDTHDNTDQNHNQENREWKLHLLDLEKYPLATCLDGSPGAYYIRPGAAADNAMTTNDNTKVFLHIEGGGWCCDTCSETCYERSTTYLGSTANDTTLGDFTYEKAYYNMNKTINPAVWDFTSVYVRYCDGASLSGLREEPINITSSSNNETTQIYSRGNYILQAIIDELFSSESSPSDNGKLSSVEQLIVSGDSAGSLAISLHAHQFAESINPNQTQMVVFLDSGFFRDYGYEDDKFSMQQGSYAEQMKSIYEMSHAKQSLPVACIDEYQGTTDGDDDAISKCMFAANHIPYISEPIFVIQSKYDSWQVENELGYYNNDTTATAIDDVNQYGSALQDELMTAISSQRMVQPMSKVFLSSCEFHTALGGLFDSDEDLNKVWLKASADGTTMNLALNKWLNDVLWPIHDNIDNDDYSSNITTVISMSSVMELESDLVSDEVFPCEECCDIVLYYEEPSPPPLPPTSSSSSKHNLPYHQVNQFRAVVVVVVSLAAVMLIL